MGWKTTDKGDTLARAMLHSEYLIIALCSAEYCRTNAFVHLFYIIILRIHVYAPTWVYVLSYVCICMSRSAAV